jgi:hypothetical protein
MHMTTPPGRQALRHWKEEVAFEVWKHYASTGGADKDRMIQIATWLLALSAGITAFALKEAVKGNDLIEPIVAGCLAIVGLIVSFASASVTLVYGGYANWNWAKADQIAKDYDWSRLDPKDSPIEALGILTKRVCLVTWALRQATPRPAHEKLAPVFWYFFWLSVASFLVHLFILAWSIR